MKLSAVATLYHSQNYVREFVRRMSDAARQRVGDDYEIILVNDGSPDNSLDIAVELARTDYHLVVVDLSRNFGHHKAMMTGLGVTSGDHVFLIDSDLEEEPEWLMSFQEQMRKERSDVVFGVQARRKGEVLERITGWFFYRLFRILTGIQQPDNIVTARLMNRQYVDALLTHKEREVNIGGLWCITGFRQSPQIVTKHSSSPTTYSVSKKIGHLVNAITSFSSKPLVFTFYSGAAISIAALIYILYLLARYFFIAAPPDGYTSLIASTWLFSGLIIFFIGVQSIYVSKIFIEVKQRPYTVVRSVHRNVHTGDKQ